MSRADEWQRLWRQLTENRQDFDPLTFKCWHCRDVGFVEGPPIRRFGMTYTSAKRCVCLEAQLLAKRVAAEADFPETRKPRNYRQLPADEPPF